MSASPRTSATTQAFRRRWAHRLLIVAALVGAALASAALVGGSPSGAAFGGTSPRTEVGSRAHDGARGRADLAAERRTEAPRQGTKLLEDANSAYSARVFPVPGGALVVTPTHVVRIGVDGATTRRDVRIGHLSALLPGALAFFRDGALWSLSLDDFEEERVATVPAEPRVLLSDGPRLVWMFHEEGGPSRLETLSAGEVVVIHESRARISVPAARDEVVYFVEHGTSGWRLGSVPVRGSSPRFGALHATRPPALLVPGPDGIYFYEGLGRGVRRAPYDLSDDSAVGAVICSPLAISERLVCANPGGLFELPPSGGAERQIVAPLDGPVADLEIGADAVYWIADRGEGRMSVWMARPLPI